MGHIKIGTFEITCPITFVFKSQTDIFSADTCMFLYKT